MRNNSIIRIAVFTNDSEHREIVVKKLLNNTQFSYGSVKIEEFSQVKHEVLPYDIILSDSIDVIKPPGVNLNSLVSKNGVTILFPVGMNSRIDEWLCYDNNAQYLLNSLRLLFDLRRQSN